jgi:cytochrome c peroxidase
MSFRRSLRPRALHAAAALVMTFASVAACTSDDGGAGGGDALADLPSPALPTTPLSYAADLPASFQTPFVRGLDSTPADNPTTDAGATLGRVLFYDRRLSKNGSVACASCHQQAKGFSDPRAKSIGFAGEETARHSMPVVDTRFYRRAKYFWDERAASLEDQVLTPIQSDVEMGMTLDELVSRVSSTDYYPPLFRAAFGDDAVTSDRIAKALAQFVRSIVSYRSRWDAAVAQVSSIAGDLPGLTAEENLGKRIFFGQDAPGTRGLCGTCHLMANELAFVPPGAPAQAQNNTAVFYVVAPADDGLGTADEGVGAIDGVAADDGKFKAPSLRNVALRGPYMHDGRFATLEEVVDHYDSGLAADPNLDPALRDGPPTSGAPIRLHLDAEQKAALVAFLKTLSDDTLATDERFSNPFPE